MARAGRTDSRADGTRHPELYQSSGAHARTGHHAADAARHASGGYGPPSWRAACRRHRGASRGHGTRDSADPGWWLGVELGRSADSRTGFEYLEIRDAGAGPPGWGGGVRMWVDPGGVLRNTTVRGSPTCGVVLFNGSSWSEDYTMPSFGNVFADVAGPLLCRPTSSSLVGCIPRERVASIMSRLASERLGSAVTPLGAPP